MHLTARLSLLLTLLLVPACQSSPDGEPPGPSAGSPPDDKPGDPPRGQPASGPFHRTFTTRVGTEGGHKSVPLLGSFDGDGRLDIVANPRVVAFLLWPSLGEGRFGAARRIEGGFIGGWGGAVGDVNADGKLDVAFGDHVAGSRVFLGDGQGGFRDSSPSGERATYNGGALGDVSGDGKPDLVLGCDQFGRGMRVYLGDGQGGWTLSAPEGLPAYGQDGGPGGGAFVNIGHFALVDLDRDGDTDMVAFGQLFGGGRQGGILAHVYRNEGEGKRWRRIGELEGGVASSVGNPLQGAAGDVNGDGFPDVAAGGAVYLSQGGASFASGARADDARVSQLGDLDGDGHLDLLTHQPEQGLRLYRGDGTGRAFTFDAAAALPEGTTIQDDKALKVSDAYGIALGDVDGNGRLDIVRVAGTTEPGMFTSKSAVFLEVWVR